MPQEAGSFLGTVNPALEQVAHFLARIEMYQLLIYFILLYFCVFYFMQA